MGSTDRLSSNKKPGGLQSGPARAFTVGWNDVQVRPMLERDLDSILDFYFRSPRDLPFIQDLDFAKVPAEAEMREHWRRLIPTGTVLVVEYKGRAVGVHELQNVRGGQAEFWAFLWNADVRGKGIVTVSWFKACQDFLERFTSLQQLVFKAPRSNPYSAKLAKKLPLKLVGSEELASPWIKIGVLADIYSVTRSEFERLHNEDNADAETDDELDDVE